MKSTMLTQAARLKTEIWDAVKKPCGLPNSMYVFIGVPLLVK